LHAQIGKAIEAKDGVKLTNNLAYHFYHGSVWDKCFQYSMLAGEDLLRKFSTWEAVQYYGYALEAQRNGGADEVQKLKALKGLADAYEECLEFEKADEIYRTLEPLMKGEDLAKVLQKRASCWTPQRLGNGDLSMLRGLIERAEKIQEVDPLFRATLMCDKASLYCLEGRPEARDLYLNALQTYLKNKLYALYAWEMLENVVKMDLSEVRLDEARREIEEVESLMKDIPWTILRLTLNKVKGQYLLLKGDTAGCLEACTRSLEQAVHYGDHYDAGTACLFMAWAMEASGDIEGMRRFAENGIKHALQCGSKGLIAVLEVQLLHAAVRRLDGAEAARARKVIKDQSIEYDSTIRTYLNGLIGVADAEMEMLAGNSSDGIIRFKNAIKMFEGVQNGLFHEALARRWFAEDLASEGLIEEAIAEFSKASTIYSKMGNKDVVVRVEKTIKML
jgi:tetratricopeptide (TPR) repeat protein